MTKGLGKTIMRAGLFGLAALGLTATSAQAGFFDLFFQQPQRQSAPTTYYDYGGAPLDEQAPVIRRVPAAPHRRITVLNKDRGDLTLPKGPHSEELLDDNTLRDGDAVMTEKGVRIYAGSSRGKKDFVRLAETKGLSAQETSQLAEINAHRNDEGAMVSDAPVNNQTKTASNDVKTSEATVTGRSSSNSQAWKWVRDPKGTMVRYVGP